MMRDPAIDDPKIYEKLVDSLWRPDGPPKEARMRPVHTHGTGAYGYFMPSEVARKYCIAEHFKDPLKRTKVTVRFSNGSGAAIRHDDWSDLRGMATRFHIDDSDPENEIAADLLTVNLQTFFTPTVKEFLGFAAAAFPRDYLRESPWVKFKQLLQLQLPRPNPRTGEKLSPYAGALEYADAHDVAKLPVYQDSTVGAPASFARQAYHAIHTFIVTGEDGVRRWVRFSWMPTVGVLNAVPTEPPTNDFLLKELTERLAAGPSKWTLMMFLAEGGDDFNSSAQAWSTHRRRIFMGTLTLDRMPEDQQTEIEELSYNPCRVVDGIALSDDEILHARRYVYEVSRKRRGVSACPFSRS